MAMIKKNTEKSDNQLEVLENYDNLFKTFRAVRPLISSQENLQKLIADGVEVTLRNLKQDLSNFKTDY